MVGCVVIVNGTAVTITVKEQVTVGEFVSAYTTVVVPALKLCPVAVPLPVDVVAPLKV